MEEISGSAFSKHYQDCVTVQGMKITVAEALEAIRKTSGMDEAKVAEMSEMLSRESKTDILGGLTAVCEHQMFHNHGICGCGVKV
jgi:hypothetical protein